MGERSVHTRVSVYAVGALLLLVLGSLLVWRLLDHRSTYEQALDLVPASTLRTTYTDWAAVREQAGGTTLGVRSRPAAVSAFLSRAYDLDLTSGSGVGDSTAALGRLYGFSPLDARWEALGQSRQGQVDVLRLDDDVDMSRLEGRLRTLGYAKPSTGPGHGGTWAGTPELVSQLSPDLTPLQQNVVVLPDQHLVLTSDTASYASEAARVATGSEDSLLGRPGVASLAARADNPVETVQWSATFACEDLRMSTADQEDQRAADQLVAKAGKISPLAGLLMARGPGRSLVLALHFETSAQASANLQPRVDLASGDAPGQGGSFRDRFRVTSGEAVGQDVVVAATLRDRQGFSDVASGPVLFATC